MRVVCALLLAVFAASCAPSLAPAGAMRVTPALAGDAIVARDGVRLPLRRWDAAHPQAVIVALHGMSDYSNAFAMPGAVWAKAGITTLAYDQRGFGSSDNPGLWAGAEVMRADLQDAVAAARARYPGVPVFALGESMGGAVLLTALALDVTPRADASKLNVDGAILVAPAVWSRSDMPLSYRVALFLGAHLLPGMILSNSAASHVVTITPSDNVPMLRALGRDPLFQKKTRTDTVFGLVNLMDEARAANPAHPPPILLLYGAKDQIIPAKPTQAVIAALGSKATVRHYEQGYHMLLRDLEGEAVDRDVADWVLKLPGSQTVTAPEHNQETIMADIKKHDLRDGNPGEDANTNATLAGHTSQTMPTSSQDENLVNPGIGSTGGVAEGQVTKSN